MSRTSRKIFLVNIVCIFLGIALYQLWNSDKFGGPGAITVGNEASATYEYLISPGTVDRLSNGVLSEDVLPAELNVRVGESIRIKNLDSKSVTVGPYFVDANSTLTQRFTSSGTYEGTCNVHPSGRIVIKVTK